MRISFLSTFHPYRGGIAQFNARLYRELVKEHEVTAFNFSRQYPGLLFPGTTQFVQPGDAADSIPNARLLDSVGPWTWGRTAKAIRAASPELIVSRLWTPFLGPSVGNVLGRAKQKGVRVVSILDNVVPHEHRFFDKPFTRYFLDRNDGFVCMSQSVLDDLRSFRPEARVILLPHPLYDHFGAPMDRKAARASFGIPEDARVILFFGLIREYKGLDVLIDAFGKLDQRYHLLIAGEPYGDFTPYQRQIGTSALRSNIHAQARYIADGEVPAFFSAPDAVVLPYRSATQSGITAIAQHFEVPVIATDVGGLKETVQHGGTGLIVPTAEPGLVASAIRDFFDREQAGPMRANIALRKQELSWEWFAGELVRFGRSL